jgi:hypothetical protein
MQTAEVYISHLDSPGEFHVQFSGTEEELERLAEKAAEVYDGPQSENYKVDNPQQVPCTYMSLQTMFAMFRLGKVI